MHRAITPFVLALACTPAPREPAPSEPAAAPVTNSPRMDPPPPEDDLTQLDALVEIDAEPGGKKFQGVWLVRDGGTRLVISYRAEPWLREFEGQRVHAKGRHYTPQGQAINAMHFRLEHMRVLDPQAKLSTFVEVGPERTLTGVMREDVGAAGTKSEGERWHVFDSETDGRFLLANTPDDIVLEQRIAVRARSIVYSPFVAHRGGPTLWVLDVDRDP
ncbi:MAG TPA: hypothetical protein VG755_41870 [Nannocystaceae bacterium]|nr:hypothetical protein [Nannocystaceae bacterium]